MGDVKSLPRVFTNELLYCADERTPSLRGEVPGGDCTGPAIAQWGTKGSTAYRQQRSVRTQNVPIRTAYKMSVILSPVPVGPSGSRATIEVKVVRSNFAGY